MLEEFYNSRQEIIDEIIFNKSYFIVQPPSTEITCPVVGNGDGENFPFPNKKEYPQKIKTKGKNNNEQSKR